MNPRRSASPLPRRSAAAFLAVAALAISCAPARAGCGGHEARPMAPLEWLSPAPTAPAPTPTPTCSGPTCSRRAPASPIASIAGGLPRLDLLALAPAPASVDGPPRRLIAGRPGLSPIGRVTDVERPPCGRS